MPDNAVQCRIKKSRILWITFHFPPRQSSGVFRPAKIYKYLDKTNLEIDFLTVSLRGKYARAVQDQTLLAELSPPPSIHRVPSPELEDLVRVMLEKLRREKHVPRWTETTALPGRNAPKPPSKLKSILKSAYRRFIMLFLFPDQYCLWGWLATISGIGLHMRRRYDLVYTTSNPQSGHLPGLALNLFGVAWIADYRDGGCLWNTQMMRYPKGHVRKKAEHCYQSLVMRRADFIVSQSETLKGEFAKKFELDCDRMRAIPNAFDESDFAGWDEIDDPYERSGNELHLLHLGLWYLSRAETQELIAGLNTLHGQLEDTGSGLVFNGVGDYELFSEAQLTENVRFAYRYHGTIPHHDLVPYLLSSDCYLLSTSLSMVVDGATGVLAGKLWEYLRGGKPILLFGPKDEAWRIVEAAGVGIDMATLRPDDASPAERLRSECLCVRSRSSEIQRHSWQARAVAMQDVFRRVLAENRAP